MSNHNGQSDGEPGVPGAEEPPSWAPRPGEPTFKISRAQTPDGSFMVAMQAASAGLTHASLIRGDVAIWLGEQLIKTGKMANSRLFIPEEPETLPDA